MAERNPPSWLQGGSHPAEHDRLLLTSILGASEGVVGPGDLAVTQNGTPNMTVNVAAGAAFVKNDLSPFGGTYHVVNDAPVNRAISAADPTNPRRDLVVVRIRDAAYSGATNAWDLSVITGTPAASPVDPAIPADGSYLLLARVAVAAAATSITNANITNLRVSAPQMAPAGSWSSWTPTWTNFTPGSATIVAKYTKVGRTVHFHLSVTLNGSTMGDVRFSLPVEASSDYLTAVSDIGHARFHDVGLASYDGLVNLVTSTTGRLVSTNGAANGQIALVGSSAPFTWVNGDHFTAEGTYEAA